MEIAKVTVGGVGATAQLMHEIPCGLTGASVTLEYTDENWAGLIKNVYFVGAKDVAILNVGDTVCLPAEVINFPNINVKIGICGIDGDQNIVIPTLWVDLGTVKPATPTNLGVNPQLPVWAQLMEMIGNLRELDTESKDDLVSAINELLIDARSAQAAVKTAGQAAAAAGQSAAAAEESALEAGRYAVTAQGAAVSASQAMVSAEEAAGEADACRVNTLNAQAQAQASAEQAQSAAGEAKNAAQEAKDHAATFDGYQEKIEQLIAEVADLKYVPIDITAISNSINKALCGTVLQSMTINWAINKNEVVSQSISTGHALTPEQRSISLDADDLVDVTADKAMTHTFRVTATDERGKTDAASTSVVFQNKVWYGSAPIPTTVDRAFALSLPKSVMTDTRKRSFAMNDQEGYYTWYIVPVRLGTCAFKCNGFDGGFVLATEDPVLIENEEGYAENCYVYRSGYDGQTGVNVEVI